MMLAVDLSYIAFKMLRCIPSTPSFLRAFIMKWCWILSKAYLCLVFFLLLLGYNYKIRCYDRRNNILVFSSCQSSIFVNSYIFLHQLLKQMYQNVSPLLHIIFSTVNLITDILIITLS
jgi:hypothetical protein